MEPAQEIEAADLTEEIPEELEAVGKNPLLESLPEPPAEPAAENKPDEDGPIDLNIDGELTLF